MIITSFYSPEPTNHLIFLPEVTPKFCFAHIFHSTHCIITIQYLIFTYKILPTFQDPTLLLFHPGKNPWKPKLYNHFLLHTQCSLIVFVKCIKSGIYCDDFKHSREKNNVIFPFISTNSIKPCYEKHFSWFNLKSFSYKLQYNIIT